VKAKAAWGGFDGGKGGGSNGQRMILGVGEPADPMRQRRIFTLKEWDRGGRGGHRTAGKKLVAGRHCALWRSTRHLGGAGHRGKGHRKENLGVGLHKGWLGQGKTSSRNAGVDGARAVGGQNNNKEMITGGKEVGKQKVELHWGLRTSYRR